MTALKIALLAVCATCAASELPDAWGASTDYGIDASPEEERYLTSDAMDGSIGSAGSAGGSAGSYTDAEEDSTPFPTMAPLPPPSNPPMPSYDSDQFDAQIAAFSVFSGSLADVPLPTTTAPTAYPTYAGYAYVPKTYTTTKIAVDPLSFPLSAHAVKAPAMSYALRAGFAAALGFETEAVTIDTINGNAPDSRRLMDATSSTEIGFGVRSNTADAEAVTTLKSNIVSAGATGALIDNIKVAAGEAGVLTAALSTMPKEVVIDEANMGTSSVEYTVYEPAPTFTAAPTPVPSDDDDDDLPIILGGVFGGLAVLLIIVFLVTRAGSSKSATPTLTPKGSGAETLTNV